MTSLVWNAVEQGEILNPMSYPLTVYRLVMAAGANRDFNAIHHNSEYAQATGAPDIYANTLLLQGMWEKFVRHHVGASARILHLRNFKMRSFNCPGDVVVVKGRVLRKWRKLEEGFLEFEVWSENKHGVSVGPGSVVVSVPIN